MKTSELTGAALDWAVAYCEESEHTKGQIVNLPVLVAHTKYSTDWSKGGPIIEREKMSVELKPHGYWMASYQYNYADEKEFLTLGDTPLIAAMRCYVASKLGDTVEIPGELVK